MKVHDYNHDLRIEAEPEPQRQQVTSYGDAVPSEPKPKPLVTTDWNALMEESLRAISNTITEDWRNRWLFGDPAYKGEGLLNQHSDTIIGAGELPRTWAEKDPYDPTATPEYQAALRFFSDPTASRNIDRIEKVILRDEAAELRETVAGLNMQLVAAQAEIARLKSPPPAAPPPDPRAEAMARAFANDGLLDAYGRPRQG